MALPRSLFVSFILFSCIVYFSIAQDSDEEKAAAPPPSLDKCNGIFLMYTFISREKELPHLKNVSAQAWAFKSTASILNAGSIDLKAWKMYIGFQHDEILVSAGGVVLSDGKDLPAAIGNDTYLSGFPNSDLKTSVETAGDWKQIQVNIDITGTQFGVKPPQVPMPKTIRLANDGYKCPSPDRHKTEMHVCCVRNLKLKANKTSTKFLPRQSGDLILMYDVIHAYEGNYEAQVTIENNHPMGRLDNWNLTWEWMRGEFIFSMKGAFTRLKDQSGCIYGPAGAFYKDLDFSPIMNCENRPVITDLPPDRAKDNVVGNIPFCCRNGSLLPPTMDERRSKAAFHLKVYKIPPDMNRTALFPPQNWKIHGVLNPDYRCGPPIRVSPTELPDPSGLGLVSTAIASWQVVCNITRPKNKQSRCCVSFSSFHSDSAVPCNTCSCGCPESDTCDPDSPALLLPSEALLVPYENRTAKARAWARLKHQTVPNPLPCGDNCGVSINWHINSDYRKGWTARATVFNWQKYDFEDWFIAIQIPKAYRGYEAVYSFNGTKMPELNNTIFFEGLPGLNYLIGKRNGSNPNVDPPVPGKQQSVISFEKKQTPGIKVAAGEGYPTRVFFNGEECELPSTFPTGDAFRYHVSLLFTIFLPLMIFIILTEYLW